MLSTKATVRKPKFDSFGLMAITQDQTGFVQADGRRFDAKAYSRFKYGDVKVAESYGKAVARSIEERIIGHNSVPRAVIVTASAYKHLPTAANAVAKAAWAMLGSHGYVASLGRIHRAHLTCGDYAAMTAEARQSAMRSNGIYMDRHLFGGHHVVVVDDIKITGAHEGSISELFANEDILSLTHMHVVRMDPELVARDPAIEQVLNGSWLTGLGRLGELIHEDPARYLFNARTAKMVLGCEEHELEGFLPTLTNWHIRQLYAGSIGDGYNMMPPYEAGFSCLHREAAKRGVITPEIG